METTLKPCPFCGGRVELEQTIDGREWWGVVCRNTINLGGTCAIQQRPSASKKAAVERWNRRTNSSAPDDDMLVALQEVLKTPGLQSGLQAMCAAAVAKALGKSIDEVLRSI